MSTQSEAQKAITMFNAFSLGERALTVNTAKAREERPNNSGGGRNNSRGHTQRGGNRRY
jgi:hypothetical protein